MQKIIFGKNLFVQKKILTANFFAIFLGKFFFSFKEFLAKNFCFAIFFIFCKILILFSKKNYGNIFFRQKIFLATILFFGEIFVGQNFFWQFFFTKFLQMSLWLLLYVQDCPRNLSLKFDQNRVSNSWDIPDMDKCRKD